MSVNDMWVSFKSKVLAAIKRFIPSKMTKTKYSSPWIDSSIKRLIKRRDRLYTSVLASQAALTSRAITNGSEHMFKRSSEMHIGSIFPVSSLLIRIALIPIVPEKNEKAKNFWSFVKSLKKDAFGINSLRENGILKTDTLDKANICNRQFESAFTRESDTEIPSKGTSPFSPMGEITVDPKGVLKLLNNLNT